MISAAQRLVLLESVTDISDEIKMFVSSVEDNRDKMTQESYDTKIMKYAVLEKEIETAVAYVQRSCQEDDADFNEISYEIKQRISGMRRELATI